MLLMGRKFLRFQDVLHMRLSAGLAHHIKVIDSLMQDAWITSYKQTGLDPLFLEP
jgi:hypothetical protein